MTNEKRTAVLIILVALFIISVDIINAALPEGPGSLTSIENRTKGTVSALVKNDSGGNIHVMNLNATLKNTKWKAYLGNVSGRLTLDDASGNTVYDWNIANSLTGEIYSTRSATTPSWTQIACANLTHIERENTKLSHTNSKDNITATFDGTDNSAFYVGTVSINANSCRTTNIYVNDTKDLTDDFEEVILYDGTNTTNGKLVYATLIENKRFGYDNSKYDFQMIVPDNGSSGFTGRIGYYFYVELV